MSIASKFAPTGTLRVGLWMVPYFARMDPGGTSGVMPDLALELARRINVKADLVKFENAGRLVAAFHDGSLDVTIVGVTADRAEAIDFGPTVLELHTTYLVPPKSAITAMADIDRPGVRIAVPASSAQEAHLRKIIKSATLLPVLAEAPQRAIEMMRAGEADAFSHVAPMLSTVQGKLPGAKILPGSYFDVPVAIGIAKGRPPAVADFARSFAEDVTKSGFVQQAIDRAGISGMVVAK
jgi:polar amino acid transport system substrate-binding protein